MGFHLNPMPRQPGPLALTRFDSNHRIAVLR